MLITDKYLLYWYYFQQYEKEFHLDPEWTWPCNLLRDGELFLKEFTLVVSSFLLWRDWGSSPPPRVTTEWKSMRLFPIPSIIYLVHNNVQFATLTFVDTSTYQIMGNLKIVTTVDGNCLTSDWYNDKPGYALVNGILAAQCYRNTALTPISSTLQFSSGAILNKLTKMPTVVMFGLLCVLMADASRVLTVGSFLDVSFYGTICPP
eukprot:Gb_00565 [translate_table: standard]